MITREEAQEKADAWINNGLPPGERQEIGMYEFEHGYVVWGVEPEPDDPRGIPEVVGSRRGIIDKQTGELSYGSSLSADLVAEEYSARRRGRE